MPLPPKLFDRGLLSLRRNRAVVQKSRDDFLLAHASAEFGDRLGAINRVFEHCLAYNARNGVLKQALQASGKTGHIIAADCSAAMLAGPRTQGLLYDEEALPVAGGRLDLIASAMSLHWANDLPGALLQIRQALKPDGLFLGAMLGGDTLHELRQSLLRAESELTGGASARVAPMADVREVGGLMQRAGFTLPVVDADRLEARYDSLFHLIGDLRAMALTNIMLDRPKTATSRALFARAAEIYHEDFAHADGRIPATFHVIYLTGWAEHESQQKPLRPGSAKQRLADALGTVEHKLKE